MVTIWFYFVTISDGDKMFYDARWGISGLAGARGCVARINKRGICEKTYEPDLLAHWTHRLSIVN